MKFVNYIKKLSPDTINEDKLIMSFGEDVRQILLSENIYPLISYENGSHIFVIIIPLYNSSNDTINMIECDIIKNTKSLFVITNTEDKEIDLIINKTKAMQDSGTSITFIFLLEVCNTILAKFNELERRLILLQKNSRNHPHDGAGDIIHTIMKLKLSIGMLKSTINPFVDILEHIFDTIQEITPEEHKTQHNQIDQLTKQIQAQGLFLYENITTISDTYTAIQNNNINNIMKTLTIISSIFIPMSFVVGFFGMNFQNMPGLNNIVWFYTTVAIMFFIGLGQLYVFKRKGRL